MIGFVYRVRKISDDDEDLDTSSIANITKRTRCWLRFSCADEHGIQCCLHIAGDELWNTRSACVRKEVIFGFLR
jgi:hypothetical protein